MKIVITLFIVMFFSSCTSSSKKPIADKVYYRFPIVEKSVSLNIKIERPSALGILGNRPMVAQNTDGSLIQMNHNYWLESPKLLLHDYLNAKFNNKNSLKQANILKTRILQFEKKKNLALMKLQFILTSDKGKTLFNKTYIEQRSLDLNTVSNFVKTLSSMIEKTVNQLAKDIQ